MAKAHVIDGLDGQKDVRAALPAIFEVRVAELWSWAEHITDPERITELHDMRIAAKRLRYCLEFMEPCFGPGFERPLRHFKKLQDYLGEIHDCDVWIGYLREQLQQALREARKQQRGLDDLSTAGAALRSATQQLREQLQHGPAAGLLLLIDDIAARRQRLYRQFIRFWKDSEARDFRAELLRAVADATVEPAGGM